MPDFLPLTTEPRPLERIDISDSLYIEYDSGDSWFAICDEDWMSYDLSGAVSMNVVLIDTLIDKLNELKATLANVQLAAGMMTAQFGDIFERD